MKRDSKKSVIKYIKFWLLSGYGDELFYTEKINEWVKKDGNEKGIMVRSAKLLKKQNREYMFALYKILNYLQK